MIDGLSPEQYHALKARIEAAVDQWTREHAHLLYWREVFKAERIARGNKIGLDEWPPRERTKRRKREPENPAT